MKKRKNNTKQPLTLTLSPKGRGEYFGVFPAMGEGTLKPPPVKGGAAPTHPPPLTGGGRGRVSYVNSVRYICP